MLPNKRVVTGFVFTKRAAWRKIRPVKIFSKPTTLQIHWPLGKTLGLALLLLALVWGGAEGVMRGLVALNLTSEPWIGTFNSEFDIKISYLDQLVRQNGKVDCIFLGSSQFDNDADPQVFTQAYARLSGQKLTCFNFSIQTLTAGPAGQIARLLVDRYHPRLFVYGISARDLSSNFGELARPLMDDPWLRYKLGNDNLAGWLQEHSYAIRGLVNVRNRLLPDYNQVRTGLLAGLDVYGFHSRTGNNLSNTKPNFIPEYVWSKEDVAGLEAMLAMNSAKMKVVVVEVPVHASFLPNYVEADPAKYTSLFVKPVNKRIQARGVSFIQTQTAMESQIGDTGWFDIKHLNSQGAKIYSEFLAGEFYRLAVLP
jgi:hypothetical protein